MGSFFISLFYFVVIMADNLIAFEDQLTNADCISKCYNPSIPDKCFDISMYTDCINSTSSIYGSRPFIFKLQDNCYGRLRRVQMCLCGETTDFTQTFANLYLYSLENEIISSYEFGKNEERDTCSDTSDSTSVCCLNITLNMPAQYLENIFIGLQLNKNSLRLLQSNISSNITICPFQEREMCTTTQNSFLLVFKAEIVPDEIYTESLVTKAEVQTTVPQDQTTVVDDISSCFNPSIPDKCFDISTYTDCIDSTSSIYGSRPFIFKLQDNCYGRLKRVQMCLSGETTDFTQTFANLYLYSLENEIISSYEFGKNEERDTCSDTSDSTSVCCFNITLNMPAQYLENIFIGLQLNKNSLRLLQSNISSNITICPFQERAMCATQNSFLLVFKAEIDVPRCANTETSGPSNSLSPIIVAVLGGGLPALAILVLSAVVFVSCFLSVKYKHKRVTIINQISLTENLMERNATASSHGVSFKRDTNAVNLNSSLEYAIQTENEYDLYTVPPFEEDDIYAQIEENMIEHLDRMTVKMENMLGSGNFGEVYKGVWISPAGDIEVAVKTLKKNSTTEDRIKFLQEVAIMAQFKDPNIVTMHGVVTSGEPILLVLEFLPEGDLRNYLLNKENRPQTANGHTLLSYCRQVVSGMVYLSNKKFVHRDLAARNVLVSIQGICKIADFGMARNVLYESYYTSQGGKIPIKWTAPEALHYKTYSTASDVWSFGMLMYEIWSLGHKPFEDLKNKEVIPAIDSGCRLPPPPGCPRKIYSLMMQCWHPESLERPSFVYLRNELSLPDTTLLQWNEEDKSENKEALELGGSLTSGKELYMDLQNIYKSAS